jgi:lysophospholipase L1-like esterase
MKILFQGDSITDAGRDRNDYHNLGNGYPKYAAEFIKNAYPDVEFEFVDLGISGNQTKDLVERLEKDFVEIQPDIVSIMIGINDVWHHAAQKDWIENDVFEARYRTVLEALKTKTKAKIMIIEPFLVPIQDKLFFREDLDPKIQVVRKLAREYADVFMPTDGLLASAYLGNDPLAFAADGVHPTAFGAEFLGKKYLEYVAPLIEEVK